MRWTIGGPDLPEELLQLLEDGRLVLFCGAGVSYPAGLPGFQGLVESVFDQTRQSRAEVEESEFQLRKYDRVLGLLEARIGPQLVRQAVISRLHIDPSADLPTHRALLALATDRQGLCRLVTTNFDRGFEFAARPGTAMHTAPLLPVPKPERWNGVVHLHGRICDAHPEGRSLVMTSADFGAAYLTERWASRFLSELFQRFTVLFVGYSVDDPVVRYMMDAFAADRAVGEGVGKAYVLAGCRPGSEEASSREWKAKGVTPLLYDDSTKHAALHETLLKWAEYHRRGLLGRESIVHEHGNKVPTGPFEHNPIVSQVVWALGEQTGHIARTFAKLKPPPPVEWIDVFDQYGLLASPYALDPHGARSAFRLPLVDYGDQTRFPPKPHPIACALGDWLTQHLNNPQLLDWVVKKGAVLHPHLRWLVKRRLRKEPPTIPALRKIWELLAGESPVLRDSGADLLQFELHQALVRGEWNLQLQHSLVNLLSPKLKFKPSSHRAIFPEDPIDIEKISHFVDTELVPECEWSDNLLQAINQSGARHLLLRDLADDCTTLLCRAMQIHELVQEAGPFHDRSYRDFPSISPNPDNTGFRRWTVFVDLCRDAWDEVVAGDRIHARRIVERWRSQKYPVFRRLCFYAMSKANLYRADEMVSYVLEDNGRWLWSVSTGNERYAILESAWPKVEDEAVAVELIRQVIEGPPRSTYHKDVSQEEVVALVDRAIWDHLSNLHNTERCLPENGLKKFEDLASHYPDWKLEPPQRRRSLGGVTGGAGLPPLNDRDEFTHLPDQDVFSRIAVASPNNGDVERFRHLASSSWDRALNLLAEMANANSWQVPIWRVALEVSTNPTLTTQYWPAIVPLFIHAPDALYCELASHLTWILKEVAGHLSEATDASFWTIWDRTLSCVKNEAEPDVTDPLGAALNRPPGHLAQALLHQAMTMAPQGGSHLPADLLKRFTSLAKASEQSFLTARVMLASALGWLYEVAPVWTETELLPFFNWETSQEAAAVWQGFLLRYNFSPAVWPRIKAHFLSAFEKTEELGEQSYKRLCEEFGSICIHRVGWLTDEETQKALRLMGGSNRARVAFVVWKRLEGAGKQSEVLWSEQIGPWLDRVWPKDISLHDTECSLNLAMAATYTGDQFASGVNTIAPLIGHAAHCSVLWDRLEKTDLPSESPLATLRLAELVVNTKARSAMNAGLRTILSLITKADSSLTQAPTFRQLDEYSRLANV